MRLCKVWSIISLMVLLSACQTRSDVIRPTNFGQSQIRGLLVDDGRWLIKSCIQGGKTYLLKPNVILQEDLASLQKPGVPLFIDVFGALSSSHEVGIDSELELKQLNRLTYSTTKGCDERDFNRVIVRGMGKNPLWVTSIALKGLVIEREGQQPLVLPYVQERLPEGQMNFSTKANGLEIEFWVAPEHCVDEETGEIYSMNAKLTINFQTFNGCAYLGQAAGVL